MEDLYDPRQAMFDALKGVGDIPDHLEDKMESYWKHVTGGGGRGFRPEFPQMPKEDFGNDPQWKMLKGVADYLKELLVCGTYHIKSPLWVEPTVTGRGIDQFTAAAGVALPLAGTVTTVLTFTIPDRYIGILRWFGHELEVPAAWGNVNWWMRVNTRPVPEYNEFNAQLGRFIEPTRIPQPIILPWKSVFVLEAASTNAADHTAQARLQGWMFPVREAVADGSFREFHTL